MMDDEDDSEWAHRLSAQHDAERAARLRAAREEATKRGKEPFSAEELAKYFIPHDFVGAEHAEILEALRRREYYYYVVFPDVMTLEEFGKIESEADLYD